MTTANPSAARTPRRAVPSVPVGRARLVGRQTLGRAVRSEWIKLTTLRSTWVTSLLTLLVTAGTGTLLAVAMSRTVDGDADTWTMLPAGTTFGEIVVAVLGTLVVTGEYSSGQIRSTLAAVPRRSRLYAAKALVVAVWAFLLGTVSILLAWALATPLMDGGTVALSDHRMLGFVWGTGLAYAALALLSLGLGFLLRSTAGAITSVVVLLFVVQVPLQMAAMRYEWASRAGEIIPSTSVNAVVDPFSVQISWADAAGSTMWLTHGQAVLAFTAWTIVALLAGWTSFTRRDA